MWVSRRHFEFLNDQLQFWMKRADDERERADRATDNLLMFNSQAPVSSAGVAVRERTEEKTDALYAAQQREMREIYDETIAAVYSEDDPKKMV